MNKKILIFSFLLIFLLACESVIAPTATATLPPPTSTSTPTLPPPTKPAVIIQATPICRPSADPTQDDIDRALSYAGQTFSADWERSYTVAESRVTVVWMNNNKLVDIEALLYSCGYDEPDLNLYFSDENWQTIFFNYESYQPAAECRTDNGLRLYQFKAQNQGFEYDVNFWAKNDTDTRVITTMFVFPTEENSLLEEFAAKFFPELPNCSN